MLLKILLMALCVQARSPPRYFSEAPEKVSIENHTKYTNLSVSEHSKLYLRDVDISSRDPIRVNGTIDISDRVTFTNSSLILRSKRPFENNGTLVLKNAKIVIEHDSDVELTNNITGLGEIEIDGDVRASGNIEVPITLNPSATLIVETSVTIHNATVLGSIQVNPNATLLVQDSSFFMNTTVVTRHRRRLQALQEYGTCIFQSSGLSGTGSLGCNTVFIGDVKTPSFLMVESLTIVQGAIISMRATDTIVSNGDIVLGGFLNVAFTGGNYTLFETLNGTISGQFLNNVKGLVYTPSSIQVVSEPSPVNLLPMIIGVTAGVSLVVVIAYKHRRMVKRNELIAKSEPEVYSYVNPLTSFGSSGSHQV